MGKAFWNGTISFGLVVIPVQLKVAVHQHTLAFRVLHKKCFTRPRQVWFCERDEVYFDNEETVRGYEYTRGKYVEMSEEDFARVPLETSHNIDIFGFTGEGAVDPEYFNQVYYVEPRQGAAKPFSLLQQTLKTARKHALGRITLAKRQHVCVLRPLGEAMALHTLFYKNEVEPAGDLEVPKTELHKAELDMAANLVASMGVDFKPESYHDTYHEELEKVIKSKLKGEKIELPKVKEIEPREDLLAALKASLQASRKEPKSAVRPAAARTKAPAGATKK